MAGHSKWANVRHRKAAQDAKRGKLFTKIIRELTVAASGGGNPADNPRLRAAVEKANLANMNRDTIQRAINRGSGEGDAESLQEVRYEGYAPGGVALLVETMTDNRNRTVSEVRNTFNRVGGNLGNDGSVAWQFARKGEIRMGEGVREEHALDIAIEAGAEDVLEEDGSLRILTAPDNFYEVLKALQQKNLAIENSELAMVAETLVEVQEDMAEKVLELIAALEDLDDVQNVYDNAKLPG